MNDMLAVKGQFSFAKVDQMLRVVKYRGYTTFTTSKVACSHLDATFVFPGILDSFRGERQNDVEGILHKQGFYTATTRMFVVAAGPCFQHARRDIRVIAERRRNIRGFIDRECRRLGSVENTSSWEVAIRTFAQSIKYRLTLKYSYITTKLH